MTKEVNIMSPEIREAVSQQEGIKAAAKKADKTWANVRKDNYPKGGYSTNKRISFGSVWRK